MKKFLSPTMDDLKLECVLMQAWKKTSKYMRYHNWYTDVLELDYQALRLPSFLHEIQYRLKKAPEWFPTPLKVVPAPKSQKWKFENNEWSPNQPQNVYGILRPLAHVDLVDQVVATAVLLCMADQIENLQGDPSLSIDTTENRKKIINYGNRLFCDSVDGELYFRWGNNKLYRQYFADYQTFLKRPEVVVEQLKQKGYSKDSIVIVQSDLSKFYDRVRPEYLVKKIELHLLFDDSKKKAIWLKFLENFLSWEWAEGNDRDWAVEYANFNKIKNFNKIALPQGLVASGFFANLFLLDFDQGLRDFFGRKINDQNIFLQDACRYVDDLRLVFTVSSELKIEDIKKIVIEWLQNLLEKKADGLIVQKDKTSVTKIDAEEYFFVPQSKRANSIQHKVSGIFDMVHGSELINAIEGFFYTQKRYSSEKNVEGKQTGLIIKSSDLKDGTAARFAAGKFRRVFRSLRPMLTDTPSLSGRESSDGPFSLVLSKQQLDERAWLFSAMLIEEWVTDPSNVRLLRIALDVYTSEIFLNKILKILEDGWGKNCSVFESRAIKQYCLAEIFHAGAIETGMVADDDCIPFGVNLEKYHLRLIKEAKQILEGFFEEEKPTSNFPWYLMQQVFLYLISRNEIEDIELNKKRMKYDTSFSLYLKFINFLRGGNYKNFNEKCLFSILAISAFNNKKILEKQEKNIEEYIEGMFYIAPSVAFSYWEMLQEKGEGEKYKDIASQLGLIVNNSININNESVLPLPNLSFAIPNPFWEEENLLLLASGICEQFSKGKINISKDLGDSREAEKIDKLKSPWQIECEYEIDNFKKIKIKKICIVSFSKEMPNVLKTPDWIDDEDSKKRYKLGQLLRFALRGNIDFYNSRSRIKQRKNLSYVPPISHWEKLRSSGYNGREAFAPEWVAISSFTEKLLFELLRWPGCGMLTEPKNFLEISADITNHLKEIQKLRGDSSNVLFLEQEALLPYNSFDNKWQRSLRIGIVQSIIPKSGDFDKDITLSDAVFRKRHRQHLVAILEGVEQMLRVRETHMEGKKQGETLLDFLIFPELAIHLQDVDSLLIPFVRKHKCMVLAGLVFYKEEILRDNPLINTAIWLIPEWDKTLGMHVRKILQGKAHLTSKEKHSEVQSWRPAQWIINYKWNSEEEEPPLRISASICYDSTDISLASDLTSRSDLYVICALNEDVGTFDRMIESLHYHMYQGVIIVNNGKYGGSSFYMPYKKNYYRQILHLHGQPQAQIAFIDIDPRKMLCKGNNGENKCGQAEGHKGCTNCKKEPIGIWKTPPAGWQERNR